MGPAGPPQNIRAPRAPADEHDAIAAVLARDASGRNGDDAAVLPVPEGRVCVSTDTAVEGVHLHPAMTARQMGYRAAACAMSDLAAMAARPLAVVAAISVPEGRWHQVVELAAGVQERASELGCALVGGDLVRSAAAPHAAPLSITVTCLGSVPAGGASGPLLRTGARAGDGLWLTGTLGRGVAGLQAFTQHPADPLAAGYLRPPDRTDAARVLAPYASATMDLSDGLAADLPKLAAASGVGFVVQLERIPIAPSVYSALASYAAVCGAQDACSLACTGGDDYELLVAIPPEHESAALAALGQLGEQAPEFTRIGVCADTESVWTRDGATVDAMRGFVHR